jgi:2-polyprenyl-3-methyl-5-hydroxy-6-metoxy-1,4-benzoquinol methylase
MITKFLLFIKKILFKLGVDIKFVRKENNISAIEHNSEESFNNFFSDEKNLRDYHVKIRLKFYKNLIEKCESVNIDFNNIILSDVGCGTGKLLEFILKKYSPKQIYGYDFSETVINYLKNKYSNISFYTHDLYNPLDFKFDAIFCTEVLEHLLYPEKALKNIINAMSEKSSLIITVPNGRIDTYQGHINFWSPESWDVFINKNSDGINNETGILDEKNLFAILKKQN